MIIVKLIGGLGNQMFQYAAARRLAHAHGVPLKLDLGWFDNIENIDTKRRYELHVLNIAEAFATPEDVALLKKDGLKLFPGMIKKLMGPVLRDPTWIRERHYHFDPNVLKLPDNVYLEGYWQSERYFKEIEDTVRSEFTVKAAPDGMNRHMAEEIDSTESVSVHVRRGDYVTNPAANKYHGTCPVEYYRQGVERVAAIVRSPHFFIFSDDPAWVKENLKFEYPVTFVGHNGPEKAHEDMRLMSLCSHHIIANSSFSWWGAWLCKRPGKTVLAPARWFNDPRINTADLLPGSWIRI